MEPFNLEAFVREATLQIINLLKKPQLIEVANHYKLEVNTYFEEERGNKAIAYRPFNRGRDNSRR